MVDRCVCSDKTFAEMKNIINEKGIVSIYELKKIIPFGENCRICMPYVEQVFKTGKTSFDVINLDLSNL